MARKPPDWHQPSLFPPDPAESPEPEYYSHSTPEGEQHAVQDNHSSTPGAEPAVTGPAQERPADASDDGALRPGTENPPRSLEGNALPDDAGQRRDPDSDRGPGARPQGSGGPLAHPVPPPPHETPTPPR